MIPRYIEDPWQWNVASTNQWITVNTATTNGLVTFQPPRCAICDEMHATDDHLLTDMEWLRAEVDEIRELAFA